MTEKLAPVLLYKFKCSTGHVQYVKQVDAHCPKEGCGCIGVFACACGREMEFIGSAI